MAGARDADAWNFRPPRAEFAKRLGQCLTWLKANYPSPIQVHYRVVERLKNAEGIPYFGETMADEKGSGRLIIQISREQLMREAYDTMIHEWTHVLTWLTIPAWRQEENEDHHMPPTFWVKYGEILNKWNYHGGRLVSLTLDPQKERRR